MKKIIAVLSVAALVLIAPSAAQAKSNYTTKQKNKYWNVVKSLSDDAYIIGKKDTIAFGIATCDMLRAGGTMEDLVDIFLSSEDSYLVQEIFTASVAAAPVVLCKDQQYKFD